MDVWGTVNVPLSAVVVSYNRTIRGLRERRERLLLAQALHEYGCLYLSRGGPEARELAVKQWNDGVDSAVRLLSARSPCVAPVPTLTVFRRCCLCFFSVPLLVCSSQRWTPRKTGNRCCLP